MLAVRGLLTLGAVVFLGLLVGVWLAAESRAQTDQVDSIVGAWTLNQVLADKPARRGTPDERDDPQGRRGRRGFGDRGRGADRGSDPSDREANGRMRNAMRELMNPPEHLTIVDTGTMIVLTGPDGRTTRLSPDGRRIKDENTGIERRTRWESGKLVSKISGAWSGKITETFTVDPEHRRLTISLQMERARWDPPATTTHIYDAVSR